MNVSRPAADSHARRDDQLVGLERVPLHAQQEALAPASSASPARSPPRPRRPRRAAAAAHPRPARRCRGSRRSCRGCGSAASRRCARPPPSAGKSSASGACIASVYVSPAPSRTVPVLARPALQLRHLGEVEDRLGPRPVEVELDEQVGAAGDRAGLGALGLQPQRLVERARGEDLHATKIRYAGMRSLLANAHVVTMDDAGTEHPNGWILVEDGFVADVGATAEPRGRRARRPRGRRGHARARQHAPPPLPDAHARPGAGGDALRVARRALPDLGAHRRRGRVRGRPHRPRRADALGLLDRLRPPLRLPARPRGARRGRGAGGAGARLPDRRLARLDGPRRLGRRPPARRARRGDRRGARRHRAARRRRCTRAARARACRSRSRRARPSPSPGG